MWFEAFDARGDLLPVRKLWECQSCWSPVAALLLRLILAA